MHVTHRVVRKQHRLIGLAGEDVPACRGLELDREVERLGDGASDGDHAVTGEQSGAVALHRRDGAVASSLLLKPGQRGADTIVDDALAWMRDR